METADARLIGSIQRRLVSSVADGEFDSRLSRREISELRSRVKKIRAMGDRFATVRLSKFVMPEGVMAACG